LVFNITRALLRIPFRIAPFGIGCVLGDVSAGLLAARLHCAWTHKVISMPSSKTLRERMVTRAQWRELMAPTAISVAAHSTSRFAIRHMFIVSAQAADMLRIQKASNWIVVSVAVIPTLIGASVLGLFVMFPAYVALVRKEASLLDPEEETIVSMDRTFGGRLSYIGDKLNFADAWNSFNWEGRKRVLKLYAKFAIIMGVLIVAFAHILALEFLLVAGDNAKDIVNGVKAHASL